MQEKVSAQYKNEIEMAKAQRDYELKKAAYDVEVNTKKAESEMAYQLQVKSTVCSDLIGLHSEHVLKGAKLLHLCCEVLLPGLFNFNTTVHILYKTGCVSWDR